MKSFKIALIGVMALFGFGLAAIAPVSAQGFVQQNGQQGIGVPGSDQQQGDGLINVVKSFINRVLGLLGLIALIVLLYGGFQMVTAAGDEEKYNGGFKILKQSGIGMIFIGLAWFVVSIIFFLLNLVTTQ